MSLNVLLYGNKEKTICFHCGSKYEQSECLYDANITHNLTKMADAAGLYKALWRPEEIGINKASELIPILDKGIKKLKQSPEKYKMFNPSNGWGSYEGLLTFAIKYLEACQKYPNSEIGVSR